MKPKPFNNPFSLPPDKQHFAPEIERALVDELYKRLRVAILGLLLTLGVMAYALADTIARHPVIGLVLEAVFVIGLLRGLSAWLVRRSPSLRLRLAVYIVGSTLTALGFATLNIIGYPLLDPTDVALLALLDAGICSAALISMGSSFLAYSLYMVPNLGSLSLIVALGAQTRWTHSLLILSLIYLSALFILSLQQAMSHRREVILRLEMADMALRDNLTHLRNRLAMTEFMSLEAEQVLRSWKGSGDADCKNPSSLGILMIDVDHFKTVNDTHGHVAGDAVLVQLADVLSEVVRKPDLVVRWGGEEFVIVARETERTPPSRLAERIRERVEQHPFRLPSGEVIHRTCSVGYALFPFATGRPELLAWEQVIALADAAMYRAKSHGRNRSIGLIAGERLEDDFAVSDLLQGGLEQIAGNGAVALIE
jgi:diguanylate cyclase (GGDEF)-like protein